ncbi:Conserved_hypothetical protein [Hexamita inflata]|uniref:Nudix hydrolase domain-containing protein n=1 Tax=Hexamita inflata TaxID=28002 RepID=A0ABP1HN37_9EUKA
MSVAKQFYFQNKKQNPVKAAGILFYKLENGVTKFLTVQRFYTEVDQEYNKKSPTGCQHASEYQDLGGKLNRADRSIAHVALREACEEVQDMATLNEQLCMQEMKKAHQFYVQDSKYLVYLVKADGVIRDVKSDELFVEEWKDEKSGLSGQSECKLRWLTIDQVSALVKGHDQIKSDKTCVCRRIRKVWDQIDNVFPIITILD